MSRAWLVLAGVVALGCVRPTPTPPQSPGAGDSGQAPSWVALGDTVAGKLALAFCDYRSRCCGSADVDGCAADARRTFGFLGGDALVWVEIGDGGLEVDWVALDACIQEIEETACEELTFVFAVPACRRVFVGRRQLGSACLWDFSCERGAMCVVGRCQAAANEDESCDGGNQGCSNGLCYHTGCRFGLVCSNLRRCESWPARGSACEGEVGAECYRAAEYCSCGPASLACPDGGACAGLLRGGSACVTSRQCRSRRCMQSVCAESVGYQDFRCAAP